MRFLEKFMNKNDFNIIDGVLLEYSGDDSDVAVPEGTLEIRIYAFMHCDGVKRITLPESVKRIEWEAFLGCTALETVCLPESVEEIEERAFMGCRSLKYSEYGGCRYIGSKSNPYLALAFCDNKEATEANIHKDTRLILARAFEECEKLKKAVIPNGVRYIGTSAFEGCASLEAVAFPESLRIIESSAFSFCESLRTAVIPNGVEKICRSAFSCASVCEVSVPASIKHIGWGALPRHDGMKYSKYGGGYYYGDAENPYTVLAYAPENIESIEIHEDTKIILDGVFFNNRKLKAVILPRGLRQVGNDAFRQCEALESINLPESIAEVGECAFASCTALQKISMPKGKVMLGEGAFMGCEALCEIELPGCNIESYTFNGCPSLKNVKISEGAKYIDEYAFSDCPSLSLLILPKNVRVDEYALDEDCEPELRYV